jgi:hypothetical protein
MGSSSNFLAAAFRAPAVALAASHGDGGRSLAAAPVLARWPSPATPHADARGRVHADAGRTCSDGASACSTVEHGWRDGKCADAATQWAAPLRHATSSDHAGAHHDASPADGVHSHPATCHSPVGRGTAPTSDDASYPTVPGNAPSASASRSPVGQRRASGWRSAHRQAPTGAQPFVAPWKRQSPPTPHVWLQPVR